jgi:FtsP/CotA-like multicopper oxidase with cupredoxin domain
LTDPLHLALPFQVVNITVTNQLQTSTLAIHWHGIRQRGSPWADGADQVIQCGIPPAGGAYSYVFMVDQVRSKSPIFSRECCG